MKPLKSGVTFANWLLRIALIYFVAVLFVKDILVFNFSDKNFYLGLVFVLFSIFILIGGFFAKPGVTVFSGFILAGLSIYKIIINFSGELNSTISSFMIMLAIGFYFACVGNNK